MQCGCEVVIFVCEVGNMEGGMIFLIILLEFGGF